MKCEECFFYDGNCEDSSWDFCRRNPPVTFWNMVQMDMETAFPIVNGKHDWCGEFKQRVGVEDDKSNQREKH